MWIRNLVFIAACLLGLGAVGGSLLRSDRVAEPSFQPGGYAADGFRVTVDRINEEFRQQWLAQRLEPAERASDLAIARRLSLSLTGAVPSLEEIRSLEMREDEYRTAWWVARLLEDRRYADYVAERLARAYVGTEVGPFLVYRRRRFVTWLSERLQRNDPYDELVRGLISDSGLWTDSPSVNFLTVTADQNDNNQPDEKRLAARTTRAFLGMRIDCLQCHDDRLGNVNLGTPDDPEYGLQRHFHQLAAFYSDAGLQLTGIKDSDTEYRYKYLGSQREEVVPPEVPFFPELRTYDGTLRQQLAVWITHQQNKPFARATVNRVWALLFGRPLVDPLDDIPLYGEFPPGMEILADDFVQHGYDLRRLIRVIAATEVFQLDSRADFEITPQHEESWAVFPLTRLRPEQVAGELIQACSLKTIDANAHIVAQLARFFQQNDFIKRYGDTGEDEFVDRGGTVTQRLLMMNGDLIVERTRENPLMNAATRIAIQAPDDETAVETAYLAVLTRRPTQREQDHFVARLSGSQGLERQRGLEDLYWVLLNSTEFSWNH